MGDSLKRIVSIVVIDVVSRWWHREMDRCFVLSYLWRLVNKVGRMGSFCPSLAPSFRDVLSIQRHLWTRSGFLRDPSLAQPYLWMDWAFPMSLRGFFQDSLSIQPNLWTHWIPFGIFWGFSGPTIDFHRSFEGFLRFFCSHSIRGHRLLLDRYCWIVAANIRSLNRHFEDSFAILPSAIRSGSLRDPFGIAAGCPPFWLFFLDFSFFCSKFRSCG